MTDYLPLVDREIATDDYTMSRLTFIVRDFMTQDRLYLNTSMVYSHGINSIKHALDFTSRRTTNEINGICALLN